MLDRRDVRVGTKVEITTSNGTFALSILEVKDGKVTFGRARNYGGRKGQWWLPFDFVLSHGRLLEQDAAILNRVMSELGKKGGKIGGPARAASMSPERRSEIARKAAQSRWGASGHTQGKIMF